MPRQIIDTESSRPRYVRRIVITIVIIALIAAAIIIAAFAGFGHAMHHAGRVHTVYLRPGNAPAVRVSWQPANAPKENSCPLA